MRRLFTLMTVLLLMALIPARAEDAASAGQDSGAAYTSLAQLADKRIGIPSGTSFDLATNSFITEAAGIPAKKKVKRISDVFQRLVAAGQRLLAVIYKNEGGTNKDLGKFADQINSLADKWDK